MTVIAIILLFTFGLLTVLLLFLCLRTLFRLSGVIVSLEEAIRSGAAASARIDNYKAVTRILNPATSKTANTTLTENGIQPTPQLKRFEDMDWQEGYKILEEVGK